MLLVEILGEFSAGVHYLGEDALFGIVLIFLLEEGDLDVLEEHDLSAGVGLVFAGEDSHQRGLAGAVRGNESDLVALIDVESDLLEKDLRSITLRYIFNL